MVSRVWQTAHLTLITKK